MPPISLISWESSAFSELLKSICVLSQVRESRRGIPADYRILPDARKTEKAEYSMSDARFQDSNGKDPWGFKMGTKASFIINAIEAGDKSEEAIRSEYNCRFKGSIGASEKKCTFDVYLIDLKSPLGHANMSRAIGIERDSLGHISLDPDRAKFVKSAIARGILKEINAVPGGWSHKDERAIEAILDKFGIPLRFCR